MTLYRIHADDRYLNYVIHGSEIIKKLGGRDHPFHIDRRPKRYAELWTKPLEVDFHYGDHTKGKDIPDIAANNGRLYLGEPAYGRLHSIIEASGEFLPVRHDGGSGYVFNPLMTAEEVDGIDESRTVHDAHGNLAHYAFHEDRVREFAIFRTEMDTFLGIFCQDSLKSAVEEAGFNGILFGRDYSNPIGAAFGSTH